METSNDCMRNLGNQQLLIGGKQFPGPRIAHHAKRTSLEISVFKFYCSCVGIRAAGELTQDPVTVPGVSQDYGRTQFAL